MSHALHTIFAVAAALVLVAPVSAQQSQNAQAGSETVTSTSAQAALIPGPAMASAAASLAIPTTAFDAPPAPFQPTARNKALMIVGGAGLLVGAIIGGDEGTIIMIAGGGVGLFGLYQYLR